MLNKRIPIKKKQALQEIFRVKVLTKKFPAGKSLQSVQQFWSLPEFLISSPEEHLEHECWEDGAPQRPRVLWPSTGAHVEVPGGMLGLGLLQEAETVGNRGPIPRGEDILILNSWSVVTGPSNDQVAGKHLFLCQRCGISLRESVLSELSEPLSYR